MKLFGDLPLVQWTIHEAKHSERLDKAFISTEDHEIADWGFQQQIGVLERPPELSQDDVQVDEVILFSLRQLQWQGFNPSVIVVLQPTSPFRAARHIDEAVELYHELNNAKKPYELPDTVFSVYQPEKFHYNSVGGIAVPLGHNPEKRLGRQNIDPTDIVVENGAIYIVDTNRLSQERTMRPSPMVPYAMNYWESLEIDSDTDWEVAKNFLDNRESLYADNC
jgi:CMP-N-acetylneuraminic acid synthetase